MEKLKSFERQIKNHLPRSPDVGLVRSECNFRDVELKARVFQFEFSRDRRGAIGAVIQKKHDFVRGRVEQIATQIALPTERGDQTFESCFLVSRGHHDARPHQRAWCRQS